jgi:hypothetical protein
MKISWLQKNWKNKPREWAEFYNPPKAYRQARDKMGSRYYLFDASSANLHDRFLSWKKNKAGKFLRHLCSERKKYCRRSQIRKAEPSCFRFSILWSSFTSSSTSLGQSWPFIPNWESCNPEDPVWQRFYFSASPHILSCQKWNAMPLPPCLRSQNKQNIFLTSFSNERIRHITTERAEQDPQKSRTGAGLTTQFPRCTHTESVGNGRRIQLF